MNCNDIQEAVPLYLSGELDAERRARFGHHLASCRTCARELDQATAVDARVFAALDEPPPDAARVERAVARRIAAERSRKRIAMAAVAAMALLAMGGLAYRENRSRPNPKFLADAARDHRTEVMEHRPRHWRSESAEIDALAARYGLSGDRVARVVPANYRLEQAKTCGIGGHPAMHLVYSDHGRESSVYLWESQSPGGGTVAMDEGLEHLAAFHRGRFSGIVVTLSTTSECARLARFAAASLQAD
jgi:anti-sigma factor RsiW